MLETGGIEIWRAEGLTCMLRFARARNPLVLEYATALLQVLKQDNLLVDLSGTVPCFYAILGQPVLALGHRIQK